MPGNDGAKCVIVDSEICLNAFVRANATGALSMAVTNSTIAYAQRIRIDGPGTVFDFVGSTLRDTGVRSTTDRRTLFGSRTDSETERDANAGMLIRFEDSTIDFSALSASDAAIYTRSSARELVFDNTEVRGDLYAIQTPDEDSVTRLKDTSLHFKRGSGNSNGHRGTFYLDNSEWVMDTGYVSLSNGKAHFVISGAAPCLDPGYLSYTSGTTPPVFDFIVPKGGFTYPPISRRYSSDTTGGIFGTIPKESPNQGTINVLAESRAATAPETIVCPLVYVKNTDMSVHLGRGVPTTLPNEKSSFLFTTDGTWEYADVAGKAESDWSAWGGTLAAAGLAVKIVGSGAGFVVIVR